MDLGLYKFSVAAESDPLRNGLYGRCTASRHASCTNCSGRRRYPHGRGCGRNGGNKRSGGAKTGGKSAFGETGRYRSGTLCLVKKILAREAQAFGKGLRVADQTAVFERSKNKILARFFPWFNAHEPGF